MGYQPPVPIFHNIYRSSMRGMLDEDGELAADREIALHMVRMIKDAWTRRGAAPGPNNDDIDLSGFAINSFGRPATQPGNLRHLGHRALTRIRPSSSSILLSRLILKSAAGARAALSWARRNISSWRAAPIRMPRHSSYGLSKSELSGVDGHIAVDAIPVHIPSQHAFGPPEDDPRPANQLSFARSAAYATPFWPHPAYRNFTGALNTHLRPHFREEDNLTSEEAVDNSFAALEQAIADWKAENA